MEKPFNTNRTNYILLQSWENLSFLHWRVDKEILIQHIPRHLTLDLYRNEAYIGIIPFMMKNVRPRWGVSIPFISNFPEFNIRTYVKFKNIKGVFFLTLDAQSIITRIYASNFFHLPYRYSRGFVKRKSSTFFWKSDRLLGDYGLEGSCKGIEEDQYAVKGSLDEFLLERYFLFTYDQKKIKKGFIHHKKWKFKKAKPKIIKNDFLKSFSLGIKNVFSPDCCHISDGVKVKAWALEDLIEI